MAEFEQGRGKGWQSVGGEEGKDVRVWTGKRERMAEFEQGRGKGWQSMDGEDGKDMRGRTGKMERI
jgi:hypothetical protein